MQEKKRNLNKVILFTCVLVIMFTFNSLSGPLSSAEALS
jgi:hypothetical protein